MKCCYLFGAGGDFPPPRRPGAGDVVIAVDGGLAACRRAGLTPLLAVGDFDSLGEPPRDCPTLPLPVQKDDTDMRVAALEGLRQGCDTFFICGGTGGRPDHTVANLQLMHELAQKGALPFLCGEGYVSSVIAGGSLSFSEQMRGTISVFCLSGKAGGVTLSGLLYPLSDATLTFDRPLGVSNAFTGKAATVTVGDGCLLVMWERLCDELPRFFPPEGGAAGKSQNG